MTDTGTMQQIVDFILEIDRLKGVTRKNRPLGLDRYENSAEHSWQIALLALSLAPYAGAAIDMNRVVGMLLVHDIGEIDTGDTIVYAVDGWEERKAAELAAVTRIFGMLAQPQASKFLELWLEFERAQTPEALFANAADRAIPVLLNLALNGQSWRENGISYQQVINRVGPPIKAGCPPLWEYLFSRLEAEQQKGWFGAAY
jgi:putative hydrolases of HD superfamily